eukprot:gnl/MRDRNA2_/MRDRNA2_64206_c0_seq3.p1 gnl/MRDRNA2_/MRDRNA2_64206_c0~~gnl/MRDRNA2_/MRDRNA2_64206_c0_seq3.p1  ORF type:complete len:123 (-),score=20.93 gnl/MRDRNA2_/MRDRNA2_64206_c0_seq3:209-577(-)
MFNTFAEAADQQASAFKPQSLANIVWALVTAGQTKEPLSTTLATLGNGQQGLAITAPSLSTVIATSAEQCAQQFKSQELSNTAWALVRAGRSDANILQRLACAAFSEGHMDNFKPQELANVA